jgi:hypothetical protein
MSSPDQGLGPGTGPGARGDVEAFPGFGYIPRA